MIFNSTALKDVFLVEPELREDDRGYFYRNFAIEEFKKQGIDAGIVHINRGYNKKKGTIRGFHYQASPKAETKIVQALRGIFCDLVIDLRPDSPTYMQWGAYEISAEKKNIIVVPKGFAHGIQTLTDDCEMQYFVTEYYSPEHERGIRYNDPAFKVVWPLGEPTVISDKDKNWPDFTG